MVNANWPFLHDEKRIVQQDLDIREYTDPRNDPVIPYTFVLEPGLVIHKIYNGYWYWGRPATHELRMDLREVSRKIRPDWKIDTPEMQHKWEDKDHRDQNFFPYGKKPQRVLAEMAWKVELYNDHSNS